ncbi:MAG: protein kinase, partial [Candidatus Aminicenantes bacterium]|nr:protein kinase [Candidatus Aminicenantes bacterium]
EDLKLKRHVALKFLPPHLMGAPELKERFLIEAQAAAALSHPNICVIHEVGESEERPFIAMECVEGKTLRDKLKTGPLRAEEALDIAIQVAAGLGEAHRKGIIHRDIKSSNIMVTEMGQAKVMDFGLAKLRGGSSITKSRTMLGTVAYMSPEQARGDELDRRTDIWSLGVVLYEMLTGELPFKGDHDQTVIHAILHREPKAPSRLRPGLPSGLDAIVLRILTKKTAGRYQTMEELREDVSAVAEGLKPLKAKGGLRRRIRNMNPITAIAAATAVLLALMLGLNVGGLRKWIMGKSHAAAIESLAVLPLENLSGDSGQDYFAAGMTETLITDLARLGGLKRVTARGSAMRYQGTKKPFAEIASELRVDALVTGSVLRSGERVSITVQLIDPDTEDQLWTNRYERDLKDVIRLQNEIVSAIVGEIRVQLTPGEKVRLASARAVNPEAYDAYLKGLIEFSRLSPKNFEAAMEYFRLALQKDPDFALAHTGIARVWAGRGHLGYMLPREALPEVHAAVSRALALDERLAEAYRALGGAQFYLEWNWEGALRSWQRAEELEPNDADVTVSRAAYSCAMGQLEGTTAAFEQALESDPYNPQLRDFYGHQLLRLRRYDDGIAQFRRVLSAEPAFRSALNGLWRAFHFKGKYDEASGYAVQYFAAAGYPEVAAGLERDLAGLEYAAAMSRAAEQLEKLSAQSILIARTFAFAGKGDLALRWLDKAYQDGDSTMVYLKVDPSFDILRDHDRFRELLRKMRLPLE